MPFVFDLEKESLKRKFSVYVVVAKSDSDTKLYVGKTGDNRVGCNPIISRCGNHFSYNDVHSQVRNNLTDHEDRAYKYIFDHFDDYSVDATVRRERIERINEMERWLNLEIQALIAKRDRAATNQASSVTLLNEFGGSWVNAAERIKRAAFRTSACSEKIKALVSVVEQELG